MAQHNNTSSRGAAKDRARPSPHEVVTGTGDRENIPAPESPPSPGEQARHQLREAERHGGTPIGDDPRD